MPPVDTQEFLASQLEILESRKEEEKTGLGSGLTGSGRNAMGTVGLAETDSRVRDHVGPVQFNVGGIQVDADDMLRRIRVRISLTHRSGFLANIIYRTEMQLQLLTLMHLPVQLEAVRHRLEEPRMAQARMRFWLNSSAV